MPLETQIMRAGVPRKVTWDYFTLSCMYTVAIKEDAPETPIRRNDGTEATFGDLGEGEWIDFSMEPIYYLDIDCGLVKRGKQTVRFTHKFDRPDGNRLIFKPGDILTAWRSSKR